MNINNTNTRNTNHSVSTGEINSLPNTKVFLQSYVKNEFDLRSLNPGEIFNGRVLEIRKDTITIQINNQIVQARFEDNVNICVGQNLNFLVKENNGNQVVIKPFISEEFSPLNNTLYKALDAASLPATDKNFDAVSVLFRHQMSLDKQSITALLSKSYLFPDADLNQLALMMKNNIEITKENISQFQNYSNGEHQLSSEVNNLIKELPGFLKEMVETSGLEKGLQFMSELLGKENTLVYKLTEQLENKETGFQQFLFGDNFQKELEENLIKQLSINPEELSNEKVKETYRNLVEKLEILQDNFDLNHTKTKDIMQTVSNMKDNLQFMKNLNENFIYTQLPFNRKDKITHSDLYVFANKKRNGNKKENTSLLLHLDMEYLGSIDIYLKLQEKKVDAKFSLSDELSVEIVKQNMENLEKVIKNKGFYFSSEVIQKVSGKELDFQRDFLEKDETKIEVTRYSFDIKA